MSQAYSGNVARSYDLDREKEPLWHVENAYVADLVRELGPRSVLDVPVGTGRFLAIYGDARVTGVDLSDAMLAEAAARVGTLGLNRVELMQGDVTKLPFADGHFDLVVCWRLLHLLPPPMLTSAFAELGRVCGGRLCVQCYERDAFSRRIAAKALRWLRRLLLPFRRRSRLTPWSHIRAYSHSPDDLRHAAESAGLGPPTTRAELGRYEGTRVIALSWSRNAC